MGKQSKWMWYYGDFELYHSQKLHVRRVERNVVYPAFWRLPEIYTSVRFRKKITLQDEEHFSVTVNGMGFVMVANVKYVFGNEIVLSAGEYTIEIIVCNLSGLPAVYIDGETIVSDETWDVDCYNFNWKKAGTNKLYTDKNISPDVFNFSYRRIMPKITVEGGGILYDCGEETFAAVTVKHIARPVTLFFGETKSEALDTEYSYLFENACRSGEGFEAKGFRYIYIPGVQAGEIKLEIDCELLDTECRAVFSSSDEMMNKIWSVAAHTFELNSREFYLDGIKRDRWVWSGDAYQSYFINRYLCFDEDIVRRTIIALGGKGTVDQHINTIVDYTFYWIISIYDYYEMTGDVEFVSRIYPRMKEFMDFSLARLDDNGFASKVGEDWIFIDWADIDKTGAVCAEQLLLLRSLESMLKCADILNIGCGEYKAEFDKLKCSINKFFWNDKKGAFIDSFESGKNNVTRHANIFALLFGYVTEEQRRLIIENVLLNDEIAQIKTPYFKFYELAAMCAADMTDGAVEKIKAYWGEMINAGATSFWEEFTLGIPQREQLDMYGMKYGKSLCHAWGASPIYLIGRYILGVRPISAGYKTFEVKPSFDALRGIDELDAVVPIKDGCVRIEKHNGAIEVTASRAGGYLICNSESLEIIKDKTIRINC